MVPLKELCCIDYPNIWGGVSRNWSPTSFGDLALLLMETSCYGVLGFSGDMRDIGFAQGFRTYLLILWPLGRGHRGDKRDKVSHFTV